MTTSLVTIYAYRITATLLVIAPIALNGVYNQNIITSLLYVPLASLVLIGLVMVIDSKLVKYFEPKNEEAVQKNEAVVKVLPVIANSVSGKLHHAA